MKKTFILLATLLLTFFVVNAQHDHHNDSHNDHHADEHADAHSSHHAHKHHLAIFNGATTSFGHHFTAYSIGLDYEYRISEKIGIGLLGEAVLAESQELITGIPIFIHPVGGLKFQLTPMALFADAHHEEEGHKKGVSAEEGTESHGKEAHFGIRLGLAYDFHVGSFSVGPAINFDYANESGALVYGLNLGIGF